MAPGTPTRPISGRHTLIRLVPRAIGTARYPVVSFAGAGPAAGDGHGRAPMVDAYSLSDKPGWNFVTLNKVLFEGDVEDHLVVDLFGEEIDLLSANDELDRYRREFKGPVDDWAGLYEPADEGSTDPEAMSNWRISYIIERL